MAEVTLKVFHISYSRKMDSKQKKTQTFQSSECVCFFPSPASSVLVIRQKWGHCVVNQSKPHQACRCVRGKGEGTEERKHHSHSFWEDFSFPKCGSTQPWCTQGVSHPLVLPLPLSFPDHMVIHRKREQGILLDFSSNQCPRHFTLGWHKAQVQLSSPSLGMAVPVLPLGAPCQARGPEELSALIPCIFKGSNSSTWQKQNQCSVVLPLSFYQQVTLSWIKMGLVMKNSHFCSAASNCSSH